MRRLFFTAAALVLLTIAVQAQDIVCTPSVPLPKQHRTNVKHRAPADSTLQVHKVRVAQVLQWTPPAGMTTPQQRRLDQPFPPRENEVHTVEGDLWRVIVEDNDCDFHLELTKPGKPKTAPRIIVEIPQGNAFLPAREKMLETLTANRHAVSVARKINLDEPPRVMVIVMGYQPEGRAFESLRAPHAARRIDFADQP